MLKATITALSVTVATAALVVSAGAASAHTRPGPTVTSPPTVPPTTAPPLVTVHALTHLSDRPDSGNGAPDPYWADDTFGRALTITETGSTGTAPAITYDFTATLKDTGLFTTIKGAWTPNQSAPYAGDVIKSRVTGAMDGYADFTFTASKLPSSLPNLGIPPFEDDHGLVPADSTSTWYELAFPAGTTFGGTGLGDWSWKYDASVKTVTFRTVWVLERIRHRRVWVKVLVPVVRVDHQQWTDAASNGYGDLAGDGNISG